MPCVKCRKVSDGESPPPPSSSKQQKLLCTYTLWSHVLLACPVGGVPGMTALAPSSCLWGYKACTHVVWCRKLAWQCCPLLWRSVSPVSCTHSSLPPHPVVLPSEVSSGTLMAKEDPQHTRDGRGGGGAGGGVSSV